MRSPAAPTYPPRFAHVLPTNGGAKPPSGSNRFGSSKRAMSRVGEEIEDVLLLSLTGLVSQDSKEDVAAKVSGLSRGDKRRNAKLAELRRLVPLENAILGIDLADKKQAVVVCDHESRVLARQTVKARAWELGPVLDWARRIARRHGFAGVTVGCEPTGHRWMALNQLAGQRDMTLVCVYEVGGGGRGSVSNTPPIKANTGAL